MGYSLVTYPDFRLAIDHSHPISWSPELSEYFEIMQNSMILSQGIGIAGVQIGISLPICIVCGIRMINPKLEMASMAMETKTEGCLSCPNDKISIRRPQYVIVSYTDEQGNFVHRKRLDGIEARCFQHELDHIKGKLIKDYKK